MEATMNGGMIDGVATAEEYDLMVNEVHSVSEETDVSCLRALLDRRRAYGMALIQTLGAEVLAGEVRDAVMDHMHVNTEILSRTLAQLSKLKVVKVLA